MAESQSSVPTQHMGGDPLIHKTNELPSVPTSPEHSRARSKRSRAVHQSSRTNSRPQIRRRESYADGTRRGRSQTRSVSPESAKRRTMRRRRSRSPSRSCSTSATETQSSNVKRKRTGQNDQANEEHGKGDLTAAMAWNESRESMRSRSKRRKKYRRRSDYAAAAADLAPDIALQSLREGVLAGGTSPDRDVSSRERARDRTESFGSVLEEDEGMDGAARPR